MAMHVEEHSVLRPTFDAIDVQVDEHHSAADFSDQRDLAHKSACSRAASNDCEGGPDLLNVELAAIGCEGKRKYNARCSRPERTLRRMR